MLRSLSRVRPRAPASLVFRCPPASRAAPAPPAQLCRSPVPPPPSDPAAGPRVPNALLARAPAPAWRRRAVLPGALGSAAAARALPWTAAAPAAPRVARRFSSMSSGGKDCQRDVRQAGQDRPIHTLIEEDLELEELDLNLYRSRRLWLPVGARGVFGGQVVGQALAAAIKTVPAQYRVHSLHSYFILAGDSSIPIVYVVNCIRDGRSFCTRNVLARQRGKTIFTCAVSFQVPEDSILHHQYPMPEAPAPETLPSTEDTLQMLSTHPAVPAKFKKYIALRQKEPIPIEIRSTEVVEPEEYFGRPEKRTPRQLLWMKAKGSLGDDLAVHQTVVAYCSDHQLLNTTLLPHGLNWWSDPQLQMIVSLDHSMYFHEPFRADEWLLYEMESPRSGGGRGLSFGRIFKRGNSSMLSQGSGGNEHGPGRPVFGSLSLTRRGRALSLRLSASFSAQMVRSWYLLPRKD